MTEPNVVLTDGWDCFIRLRRGVYARVNRRGQRMGGISTNFEPAPRWRPAKVCSYDATTTLWCERCGAYDIRYAESGVRSYCLVQSPRRASLLAEAEAEVVEVPGCGPGVSGFKSRRSP